MNDSFMAPDDMNESFVPSGGGAEAWRVVLIRP